MPIKAVCNHLQKYALVSGVQRLILRQFENVSVIYARPKAFCNHLQPMTRCWLCMESVSCSLSTGHSEGGGGEIITAWLKAKQMERVRQPLKPDVVEREFSMTVLSLH